MKKVTLLAAETVIGGHCLKGCTDSYELVGNGLDPVCTRVRTCYDKFGKQYRNYTPATDDTQCRAVGFHL